MTTPLTYTFRTLTTFDGTNGRFPSGGLTFDAAGDIYGTTQYATGAGGKSSGNVFELQKTSTGYAATPTVLADFSTTGLESPEGGVVFDAAGNLIGPVSYGTGSPPGLIFELQKTGSGFGPPTQIASFAYATTGDPPTSHLIADAAGNLYGVTGAGGAHRGGTVFELKKTSGGYDPTPIVVAAFDQTTATGGYPSSVFRMDAAGNLFGSTLSGGANNTGAIYEIPKSASGFGAPIVLQSGSSSVLLADAAGNLYGTTAYGGAYGDGSVFELRKTASGFDSMTTLVSFDSGTSHSSLSPSYMVFDKNGDLIGTTGIGSGGYGLGTVFRLTKSGNGFSSPTTLLSFDGKQGQGSVTSLTVDAAGNIFGTTAAVTEEDNGSVFELQLATSTVLASVGAVSGGRTAVVFSGVALDPRSTIAVYRGAPSSATLLGTPTVRADGSWSLSTTLAAGTYDSLQVVVTDSTGRAVDVPASFTIGTGITGQAYVSNIIQYDTGGRTTGIKAFDAAGRLSAQLTYAADRTFTVYHPVTGQPYTSFTDNYEQDGTRTSTTYSGITGQVYTAYTINYDYFAHVQSSKVYNRADGSVYAVQTPTPNGGSSVQHPGITGQPYTAYTNFYDASHTLLGTSYTGYSGDYETRDVSLGTDGRPVSQALLHNGSQLVGITSYNPDGSEKAYVGFDGSGQQTATNSGLIVKNGSTDYWEAFSPFSNTGTVKVESGVLLLGDSSNTGTIDVGPHSELLIYSGLAGNGTVSLHGAGSVADIQSLSSNTVAFTDSAAATLKLSSPSSFTGQIKGFNGQSTLDLFGFSVGSDLTYTSNASHTAGTLTITDGSYQVGLAFAGNYTQSDFAPLAGDGTGSGILVRHA